MAHRPLAMTPAAAPLSGGAQAGLVRGVGEAFLIAAGCAFVAGVALLDSATGSRFSFGLFYLVPVAACAWWGGFASGVLMALTGAAAWHGVDALRDPPIPLPVLALNGVIRFATLTLVASLVARLHAGIRREYLLARTDPLTGAANGRTFYAAAASEAGRARRAAQPLTLAYFDLDHFKQLNDRLGHAAGDAALCHLVEAVQARIRRGDVLARLGGDEFALLLPGADAAGAASLLARIQEEVGRAMAARGWAVTLSVGAVTFLRPPEDVDQMVRRVDALMYVAKRKGKCRVEHRVADGNAASDDGPAGGDRRATARVVGSRAARVRAAGEEGAAEEFATVCDVSALGIGLKLAGRFALGTVLLVEPLAEGAKTLLARVVRVCPEDGGWRHGCELSIRLGDEEILAWAGVKTATPEAHAGAAPQVA